MVSARRGDSTPDRRLAGAQTGFQDLYYIGNHVAEADNDLYVADRDADAIWIFAGPGNRNEGECRDIALDQTNDRLYMSVPTGTTGIWPPNRVITNPAGQIEDAQALSFTSR